MLDVFMIALTVLSCLLGSPDAARFDVDVVQVSSGEVQTYQVERTKTGFTLSAKGEDPVTIRRGAEGSFEVQLPGGDSPVSVDLNEAQIALKAKDSRVSFKVDGQPVRVTRSKGLSYITTPDSQEAALFVVRTASKDKAAKGD